ncbi:MAG TPA: thioredoxin domain-containing protein [Acidimicrobiales bacterium]|nr:thioredoxin domain-containing protein [Acidimicrobiales bacterium]
MPNRLAQEASPYLRQHADNPVDWFPWGEEAFAKARSENRPILLSVGYSACHWCHVMAHESFEDPDVAAVMNELFVNVKVDREERPDVDSIYMEAVQALSGQGGWPMTVFLTPTGEPFYGGTYYPPRATHGRPGFLELMRAIDEAWRERRDQVDQQARQLTDGIRANSAAMPAAAEVGDEQLDAAVAGLMRAFDQEWGGFGGAPKFPQPSFSELLLHRSFDSNNPGILAAVASTAAAMAAGGIYDHLGGGFARYAVERTWTVPHFEKMLYDQAGLIRLYTRLWRAAPDPAWAQVVDETITYVLRDLAHPEGGICAAEDADSEGVEGKFYVWSLDEVTAIAPQAVDWYGVSESGNFEGTNILRRPLRQALLRPAEVEEARRALFQVRETRVRPGLDDKVLTEWNAMFLGALCEAAATFGRADWESAARALAERLPARTRRGDGRWMRAAGSRHLAVAADYAWVVDAYTRLTEMTGDTAGLETAVRTAHDMVDLFWDKDSGGLLTVAHDSERLITQPRDTYDGATPSANSVAAVALARLGALTSDRTWTIRAEEIINSISGQITRSPTSVTNALLAVDLLRRGIDEVVITGSREDLLTVVQTGWWPRSVLAHGRGWDSPLWEGRKPDLAYVCRDASCRAPVGDADSLRTALAPG